MRLLRGSAVASPADTLSGYRPDATEASVTDTSIPLDWYFLMDGMTLRGGTDPLQEETGPAEPVRVILVERDPFVKAAVLRTLENDPDIADVRVAGSSEEALALTESSGAADVVVCQVETALEGEDALLPRMTGCGCHAPVLAIVTRLDARLVSGAAEQGVAGWIHKEYVTGYLSEAIRFVAQGRPWIDPESWTQLLLGIDDLGSRADEAERKVAAYESPLARLKEHERELLPDLVAGLSNPEIAERRHVSVHTVKDRLRSIYRKLGVKNRQEAAAVAREFGVGP
jgi:DNA-binding NarL/FixJ family response regulator